MKNPRPTYPLRSRAVEVTIGLAIAAVIGAASILPISAYWDARTPDTCAERATSPDPCGRSQVGSVRNP